MSEADGTPRLAVYGSLAPGKENHGQVADLRGQWLEGTVRGRLIEQGWGASMGFPALVLDGEGEVVPVMVLESDDLAGAWERLDEFEGAEYDRVLTEVRTAKAMVSAYIYAAKDAA
ncbi:gamma-glutamylcyclotransferase family protein [Terriglobus aquaticus]|uniref:Gamma-glutamylcyclotransferase n=1 Tax=Terriglobus aquaticus TaxID=940139 RepID=A0ABW9KHZ9_9BACT|nr:gamma-glutamylcyclotransferase [Terriglobus aquaticus]